MEVIEFARTVVIKIGRVLEFVIRYHDRVLNKGVVLLVESVIARSDWGKDSHSRWMRSSGEGINEREVDGFIE